MNLGRNRHRQRLLGGPAALQAHPNCRLGDPCSLGPLNNRQCLAAPGESPTVPAIAHLHLTPRPPTVPRFVVPVDVDSIDRKLKRRAFTHVGIERLERVSPSCAYANPAAAISGVARIIGVRAAMSHGHPRRPCRLTGAAMPAHLRADICSSSASTMGRLLLSKRMSCHCLFGAAVTPNAPCGKRMHGPISVKNRQKAKPPAGHVYQLHCLEHNQGQLRRKQ
jgi:hypothetical protein